MDIDGLGPAIIDQLLENGLVRNVADFIRSKRIGFDPATAHGEKIGG